MLYLMHARRLIPIPLLIVRLSHLIVSAFFLRRITVRIILIVMAITCTGRCTPTLQIIADLLV